MSSDKRSGKRWGNTTSKDGEPSRIFVGNLPHSTNAGELEDKFKPYGDLEGVDINSNGFAFVQFRTVDEAKAAVSSENGSFLGGRKIEVRMFDKSGPKKSRNDNSGSNTNRGYQRDRSPHRNRGMNHGHSTPEPFAPGFHPQQQQLQFGQHPHHHQQPQPFNTPMAGMNMLNHIPSPHIPVNANQNNANSSNGSDVPNDVEIIVIDREQWAYGETVEKRLKDQAGIPRVDMLFLHSPQHISMTLNDLFDRGTLYAVVVAPENEVHGTVTIHVLQNQTEYRNISLDKAIGVIASEFQGSRGHMDSRNGASLPVGNSVAHHEQLPPSMTQDALPQSLAPAASSLPPSIQSQQQLSSAKKGLPEEIAYLLRTTLNEQGVQFLSLQQIDSIIDYFTRERDRLMRSNNGRQSNTGYQSLSHQNNSQSSSYGDFSPNQSSVVNDRQPSMSVRGPSGDMSSIKPPVVPSGAAIAASNAVPNNLLDNPHVKQALSVLGVNLGALGSNSSVAPGQASLSSNYDQHNSNNSNGIDRFSGGYSARRDQVSSVSGNTSRMPPSVTGNPPLGRGPGLFGGPARF